MAFALATEQLFRTIPTVSATALAATLATFVVIVSHFDREAPFAKLRPHDRPIASFAVSRPDCRSAACLRKSPCRAATSSAGQNYDWRAMLKQQEIPVDDTHQRSHVSTSLSAGRTLDTATRRIHVAPMMGHTDCAFRHLMRLISEDVVLWTEMVVATELLHKANHRDDRGVDCLLRLSNASMESPVVLQLGGSNPEILADAVALALLCGYSEINLNCGCPGKLATKGQSSLGPKHMSKALRMFNRENSCGSGAAMMKTPELVRDCTTAMSEAAEKARLPVSVKCRIGVHDTVDDMRGNGDAYDTLARFVDIVASAGHIKRFHVHARSAVLDGLGAYANREVPPLRYDFVYRLAEERPELSFTLNGGILCHEEARLHMSKGLDVMVGRWVLADPWALRSKAAERRGRHAVLQRYLQWALGAAAEGYMDQPRKLLTPLELLFKNVEDTKRYHHAVKKLCSATNTRFNWIGTAARGYLGQTQGGTFE